ncbi:uncharacterized protein SAPINGB_P004102 [Magnusiomyces paraingens]|uniref:tRNA(Ile)-lysidine synthetase n=1 Tax=Magnusiomyces paraingens TaxID=2606893 RepID=A0A5E8BTR6_9ASCO|nr:uncharacterized protein SAPINGB_P004102 [Saprochaete ingens]VVT54491.1 unnamed protein product [Saprochaete ingens]
MLARFTKALETSLGSTSTLPKTVCIAVSGGVDSMALTSLATRCLAPLGTTVIGLTVDHGLRPESAEEAQAVGSLVRELGAQHEILKINWNDNGTSDDNNSGAKPNEAHLARFELEARTRRLRLLRKACQRAGARHLLLAHTQDDQLETMLLRLTTGSSLRGLAAMAARAPYWEISPPGTGADVLLVRPLLGFSKNELYGMCKSHGVQWFEDPTNADPGLTLRNAIRSMLADQTQLPRALRRDNLLECLGEFQERRAAADAEAARIYGEVPHVECEKYETRKDGVEAWIQEWGEQNKKSLGDPVEPLGSYLDVVRGTVYFGEWDGLMDARVSAAAGVVGRLVARVLPGEERAQNGYAYVRLYRAAMRMQETKKKRRKLTEKGGNLQEKAVGKPKWISKGSCEAYPLGGLGIDNERNNNNNNNIKRYKDEEEKKKKDDINILQRIQKKARRKKSVFAEKNERFTLGGLEWTRWGVYTGGGLKNQRENCEGCFKTVFVWEIRRQAERGSDSSQGETRDQWQQQQRQRQQQQLKVLRRATKEEEEEEKGWVLFDKRYWVRLRPERQDDQEQLKVGEPKPVVSVGYPVGIDARDMSRWREFSSEPAEVLRVQPCVYIDGKLVGFPMLHPDPGHFGVDVVLKKREEGEEEDMVEVYDRAE